MSSDGERAESLFPAYVPFGTAKNFIESLAENGIPNRIDKTTMLTLSGGSQSHLTSSLKFLGLINSALEPQPALHSLVETVKTDAWKDAFRAVVDAAYAPILNGLDLKKASFGQLQDSFKAAGMPAGATLEKSIRFFLTAVKESGIETSGHLSAARKPRAPAKRSDGSGRGRSAVNAELEFDDDEAPLRPPAPAVDHSMIEFPVYFGNSQGRIIVPKTITPEDCEGFDLALAQIRFYAGRQRK